MNSEIPVDLREALTANPVVEAAWNDLTDIGRRDFTSWITSAKLPETRTRRVSIAIDKLLKGQRRPCCYAVVPMDLYKALGANPSAKVAWSGLSANEKRDFSDYVEESDGKEMRKARVAQSVAALLAGKRRPT